MFGEILVLFFGIPLGMLVLLVYCCGRYRDAKKQHAADPGQASGEALKKWKRILILVSVVTAVLVSVVIGIVVLFFAAIAFM